MADAMDSKSIVGDNVWVQVPPSAPKLVFVNNAWELPLGLTCEDEFFYSIFLSLLLTMNTIRCIFFDRDGTLGELTDKRYPQTFSPFCDIRAVFTQLKNRGFIVGILTNQSSIARGTGAGYDFDAEFAAYNADNWEICPHDTPDDCDCRKPKSGLLLRAAQKLNVPLNSCLIVGDRLSDIQCAKNVGAHAALVLTGYGENEKKRVKERYPDVVILSRFDEVLNIL